MPTETTPRKNSIAKSRNNEASKSKADTNFARRSRSGSTNIAYMTNFKTNQTKKAM